MRESYPAASNISRMPGGGVTLFRIRGIRIAVDYSWFVVLFLIIFWLSGFYRDVLDAPRGRRPRTCWRSPSATLFFGSILLHELGHAFVAPGGTGSASPGSRSGCSVASRAWRRTPTRRAPSSRSRSPGRWSPRGSCRLRAGGLPLAGAHDFRDAALTRGDTRTSGLAALIAWLGSINLLVLIFNLVPAFPLDGGRIARAIAWWRYREPQHRAPASPPPSASGSGSS